MELLFENTDVSITPSEANKGICIQLQYFAGSDLSCHLPSVSALA